MEQQAKERLTGGVILVVALVLLVPELLTGPRPPLPAAPTQPDQAPMRSYTLDLRDSAHADSAPVAASTDVPPASETPPPPVSSPAQAVATPPAPAAAAQPRPEIQPRVAPSPATHASSAATAAHGVDHGTAAWTVQLATFGRRENATRLVTEVKSHGFSAAIAETTRSGHTLFRVRVGNERDRAAAQKLLAHLRAAGEKGGEVVPR